MANDIASQIRQAEALELAPIIIPALRRGVMSIEGQRINYHIAKSKSYSVTDPEEKVRAQTIAFLVLKKGYDPRRIETEVVGTHGDYADVVLYRDAKRTNPWLVIENKKRRATPSDRAEAQNQAFANAIALKARYAMIDFGDESRLWQIEGFGSREREANMLGTREMLPANYSEEMVYGLIAGTASDISPADARSLSLAIRRAHSIIWAGGKRDPLNAFDEWSKMMFAKVRDERYTPNGKPRMFQAGVGESDSAIANRIHELYDQAREQDATIFPEEEKLDLPDSKIASVVREIQGISFMETDSDIIGTAFEDFFGSVFRGSLGQYFTMRPIARFAVGMLEPCATDYILDPTCGSGGFLLETLLQVWRRTDTEYAGQSDLQRIKMDFAANYVYGIEIHPTLARICKISLLLHHDGHTNIESDKSCLSPHLHKERLAKECSFDIVVGNPPFGTKIEEGDEDQLDGASLKDFEVSCARSSIQSEQLILERSVRALKPGGRLAMVLPDGVLNNAGEQSNCPATREWLFRHGRILGVVSLPDFAFRRSGATNKTSILVFERFSEGERARLESFAPHGGADGLGKALVQAGLDYLVFFAEANFIGYTPSGRPDSRNDLYNPNGNGYLSPDQSGSILGQWRSFEEEEGVSDPRCAVMAASEVWSGHPSHRLDPKYHVYKAHDTDFVPTGWRCERLGNLVARRRETVDFSSRLSDEFRVLTLSQEGTIRLREPGIGNNPPEWLGMYFHDSSSRWSEVHAGDIVYSGIDLWKGVVCYVTPEFDGALVTQEYPVLRIRDNVQIDPEFLAILLRSKRFQAAFRAINTGHSNRRRTQPSDFDDVLVYYPPIEEQRKIAGKVKDARKAILGARHGIEEAERSLDLMLRAECIWADGDELESQ